MDKKKNTTLIVILVAAAMIIVAAGIIGLNVFVNQQKGNKKVDKSVTHTAIEADDNKSENKLEDTSEDGKADGAIADFVQAGNLKLGNYVGIEVDVEPTEDDILEAMKKNLKKMTKDHKGKIQKGDYVCLDYNGSIDGQEYEDFSDKGEVLRVGDYDMGEEFEKSLIGKQPGDKVSVSVTYDDSYEGLEGVTVDYKITIKGRFDDYYADKFSKGKCSTVKEYIDYVTETVRAENKTPEMAGQSAWESVLEDSEVVKYPEGLVEEETVNTKKQYEDYAEFMGVSYEELLEQFGMDEDGLKEIAQDTVKERLVVKTIMAKENLVLDDASYEKYLRASMEATGKEDAKLTLEELEQKYKKEYGGHPKDDMMLCLVQEFVGGKAKTE